MEAYAGRTSGSRFGYASIYKGSTENYLCMFQSALTWNTAPSIPYFHNFGPRPV